MPSAEITAYTVQTGRLGQLGTEKIVILRHQNHGADGETVEADSEIYFADRFASSSHGYVTTGSSASVSAYLPEAEYLHWIDLLRYEDPVFLHWTESADGQADPDGIIHLATGPEPTGEGPIDLTP